MPCDHAAWQGKHARRTARAPVAAALREEGSMRVLYNLALMMVAPFLPLRLWWRGRREPGYRHHVSERFGFYRAPASAGTADTAEARPLLWLHAVSLGETRAAYPLVRALREKFPDHRLLVTQMTATGREAAVNLYGDHASIAFLPYDLPWAVRRFLAHFRPQAGIVMETEVWPNLLRECRRAGVPVILANARLSQRSARGYARVASLARQAFADLTIVGAQTAVDAERFRTLGASAVEITGNMKFDVTTSPELVARGQALRDRWGGRPTLLLASSRDGEEALVLDALAREPLPAATLLVIVPRHPQRFGDVAALLEHRGVVFARRSDEAALSSRCAVVLGDSLGEMTAYFAACDVAIIGGSLLPFGSQNLIEACAAGAPVIIGPSTFNFELAAELALAAGAAVRVTDAEGAIAAARALLADARKRDAMAEAGRRFAVAHRGATVRTIALVERVLEELPSRPPPSSPRGRGRREPAAGR
jgi:3-deoxy-D-manno-octulosonic-acid transferase